MARHHLVAPLLAGSSLLKKWKGGIVPLAGAALAEPDKAPLSVKLLNARYRGRWRNRLGEYV